MQLKIMLLFNLSENGNFTIKNFKFLYKNNKKKTICRKAKL